MNERIAELKESIHKGENAAHDAGYRDAEESYGPEITSLKERIAELEKENKHSKDNNYES